VLPVTILFNLYGEYLMKDALDEVGDFKIGGRIINKVKFVDDTAIIAETQEELQDVLRRMVNTGRMYSKEINIDNSQVMGVSRSIESSRIKVGNRELKEVGRFKYLGSELIRDGYFTREIKTIIAIANEALNRKISSKLNIELRKKLVRSYVLSIELYVSETWTVRKLERKYLEIIEM
jgi:Reverse transcriptase (RNA-dependent DNA polymerase).